jgi:hypothetical protein
VARATSAGNTLSHAAAAVTAVPLSIACWFNPTAANTVGRMVQIDDGTNTNRFTIGKNGSGNVNAFTADSGGTRTAATSTTFAAGSYHHACGVFEGMSNRAAYLNGGGKGTNGVAAIPANLAVMRIATEVGGTNTYAGDIAEVTIWNVALTDADVADLAKGFAPWFVRPDGIVAHWSLFGRSSPEPEFWGRYDMSLTGTPGQAGHPRIIPLQRSSPKLMIPRAAAPAAVAASRLQVIAPAVCGSMMMRK